MIVWLASYPRSGNTLLRQILKQCFGLCSFESLDAPSSGDWNPEWEKARELFGGRFATQDPDRFLKAARKSPQNVLIKTHDFPKGTDRAIYVVRDGRLALESYVKYRNTFEGLDDTFTSLLLGDHGYRDWTTHYRWWTARRNVLVLRFEELVNARPELLAKVADFLHHEGPITAWTNPQSHLQKLVPSFFQAGQTQWTPDAFWTPARLSQFATLHGPLSCELGYLDLDECQRLAYPSGSEEERLLRHSYSLACRFWQLRETCPDLRNASPDGRFSDRPSLMRQFGQYLKRAGRRVWPASK